MKETMTVTTKGTFTMPAKIRKQLGINTKGDKVVYTFNTKKKQLIIEKPSSDFRSLQKKMKNIIDPSIMPLLNVDEYYQKNRRKVS